MDKPGPIAVGAAMRLDEFLVAAGLDAKLTALNALMAVSVSVALTMMRLSAGPRNARARRHSTIAPARAIDGPFVHRMPCP